MMQNEDLDSSAKMQEPNEIEPLGGEVCLQFIRCGKAGCRCQSGRLHGPYNYRIWREGSRVRKVYVKAEELEAVKAGCMLHRRLTRSLQEIRQEKQQLTQSIYREWRRTEKLRNKTVPPASSS